MDLLCDRFSDTRAVGAIEGTNATPGPGLRSAIDTESKLSVSGGVLICTGGKDVVAWSDPSHTWTPTFPRLAGRMLAVTMSPGSNSTYGVVGWRSSVPRYDAIKFTMAGITAIESGGIGNVMNVGWFSSSALMQFVIPLRTSGAYFFARGGIYADWSMLWPGGDDCVDTPMTAGFFNYNLPYTVNYVGVPSELWLPSPEVSDGFSASVTDGCGHAEGVANGLGAGGSGLSWVSSLGTWQSASNVSNATALSGGSAIRTIALTTPHNWVLASLTRSASNVGLVTRYSDTNNYVYAYHDGTNITLRKVVSGSDSEVMVPTAASYGNGYQLAILANETKFRVLYKNLLVGSEQTITDVGLQTGTMVGLYTTSTSNTFDDALVYPQGKMEEYSTLTRFFQARDRYDFLPLGDSKTFAQDGYPPKMSTISVEYREQPWRIASDGQTTAGMKAIIDAQLAIAVGTPNYVLMNLSANDSNPLPSETDWKTNQRYIIAALHTKWANAQIYLMRFWTRGQPANCDTLDGWIADIVAEQTYLHLGPDERIFLENGDDGVTYTSDGIHPNQAGYVLTAAQWRAVLAGS